MPRRLEALAAALAPTTPTAAATAARGSTRIPTRPAGRLGVSLPVIGFGAFALTKDRTQEECNAAVARAVAMGATYFDVAPMYGRGTAEALLGPALAPHRAACFLSCKTAERSAAGATRELNTSLERLQTDHLDLYQMHAVQTAEDVEAILQPGGALEAFREAKAAGKVRHLGFSAHDEESALTLIETDEFDSVMFPLNFVAMQAAGFGRRVLAAAKRRGMAVLALKTMARGRLSPRDDDSQERVLAAFGAARQDNGETVVDEQYKVCSTRPTRIDPIPTT